ncbi:hypothetical protein AVEN_187612-1 [Araneus ventricosus]|uniref:Uncharacterized protein n=1 Tax=Araneus ventricosus TaxID=182803 RepID=A0A4Y2S122_ARAVE|nr:hypothetical protein AVEN_187612-1 [Araneus ventricosus]
MVLNLIPEEQYGFRSVHNTIDQILYFAEIMRDTHNMKPTNHTITEFLDLTKAFGMVWKNKLLVTCPNEFNIRGRALPWISNFLNNRFFRVKYQGGISNIFRSNQDYTTGLYSESHFVLTIHGWDGESV